MADPLGGTVTFGEEDLDEQSPVTFGESDISEEHPPAAKSAPRPSSTVTPIQRFLNTTRPTPRPAAAPPVSAGKQPTTQNLTGNEEAAGEVIPPSKPGSLHPDQLDAGAWSLFGKENFADLSQPQKDAVVRAYSKTTVGQSIASPEGRNFIATGEKQGPIIEGSTPEPSGRYDEAVKLTKEHGSASVSLLQHRLKIGYEEAAHLVNRMSDEGLVEAANGPHPHPVIETPKIPQQFTEQDIQQHAERREPGNAALREKLRGMSSAEKDRAIEEYHNRERTSAKTGLPNYLAFEESAGTMGESHPHVGYADVDDFKRANEALGHYGVEFVGLEPKSANDRGLLSTAARISGFRLLDNMRLLGQRTMWMSNDVFMLQSAYEKQLQDPSLSFKDAMAQVARHIPDYRVPDRVMNSKRLSDVMRHPLLTIFSRYHYGVWKSYGQMLRETFSPDSSLKDRARGLDHMLMLGLVTFVLYELWDHALKAATGDKNARMVRSGASAVPAAIQQVVKGQREPGDLVTASLTPNPLLKTGTEIALNRDSYTGSKVYDEHDSGMNILSDIGMHALAPLGPVQQYKNASHQDQPTRNFLFSQAGVTFPKYESQTPAQKLMHDIMRDNLSITPELRRELQDRRDRIARGEMSQKERKSQLRKAALDEFQFYLPHLRYSEIKQVFHAATPEEKEIIRPLMLKKAVQVMRSNPFEGQREGALDAFNEK